MEIVNGHTGQAHILPIDMATMIKMFIGNSDYILPYGGPMTCTQVDAYTVQVNPGYIVTQGRMAVVREGEGESFEFRDGVSGKYRVHLIVCEYMIDDNDIESMTLEDIQGDVFDTATTTDPEIITGDIDSGQRNQTPLYRITLNGTQVSKIEQVIPSMDVDPVSRINAAVANMNEQLALIRTSADTAIANVTSTANTQINKWKSFYYGKGSTIKFGSITVCHGFVSNSSKDIYFYIPTKPIVNGTLSVVNLYMRVMLPNGGYASIVSGNSKTPFGPDWVLVSSGSQVRVAGISEVTTWAYMGCIKVRVRATGSWLQKDAKTKALNNAPVAVMVGNDTTFSLT